MPSTWPPPSAICSTSESSSAPPCPTDSDSNRPAARGPASRSGTSERRAGLPAPPPDQETAMMTTTNAMSRTVAPPAASAGPIAPLAASGARLGRFPLAIHQLLFRLAIAGVFLRAGVGKVRSWESTIALFRDEYRVPVLPPEIAAVMASSVEIGCSLLLVLGLCTRL